jgi:hypothetical protein
MQQCIKSLPRAKRLERENRYFLPYAAEVKNDWSVHEQSLYNVVVLIHKENFVL